MAEYNHVAWTCTYCGKRVVNSRLSGRPVPGQCPRKSKDASGKYRPHSWTVEKKW